MAQEHFIKIDRTVRYYTVGTASKNVKHLWICLHGYGQLGKYFIRSFSHLENENRLIVAPEAPNRFYLNGTGGRVGATWMTKDERLRDIDDYCTYLNKLCAEIKQELSEEVSVHIFGFSQGVATAYRWANNYVGHGLKSLTGWAGTFPPDIDYRLNKEKFNALNIKAYFASNDQYISHDNADDLMKQLADLEIDVTRIDFEGEHKLYAGPLMLAFNNVSE